MSQSICIVTGNPKKFFEMKEALSLHGLEAQQLDADLPELQTLNQREVIAAKTRAAFAAAGGKKAVLVDDSGIYIPRFHQFPGVLSKYVYQMIGYKGFAALLQEGEPAFFQCFIGYMDAEHADEPVIFEASFHGTITLDFDYAEAAAMHGTMPYVPLFVPTQQPEGQRAPKPLADFTPQERAHDHRHQAIAAFAAWYAEQGL